MSVELDSNQKENQLTIGERGLLQLQMSSKV
jgi:hypothetical protein